MRISALLVPMLLVACNSSTTPTATSSEALRSGRSVLVSFRGGIDRAAIKRAGGEIRKEWAAIGAVAVRMPEAAIAGLSRNPNVESIEPDRIVQAATIVGSGEDPWGNIAVHADVTRAAGLTGQDVTVCVLDTGIDFWHPEFADLAIFDTENDWDFVGDDGIDGPQEDGDPSDGDCSPAGCTEANGHGTHVTGTIAAQLGHPGDGAGVYGIPAGGIVGVSPGVTVAEYRVLGVDGFGTTSGVIDGILACASHPASHKVASLSLGSDVPNGIERKAFGFAEKQGVLIVAAAGNDANRRLGYPASYPSVIPVAAVDADLQAASFSQVNPFVELSGPGVHVLSTYPRQLGRASQVTVDGTEYPSNPVEFTGVGSVTAPLVDCGLCGSATSCGTATAPFVAYCDRGGFTFAVKAQNVMDQGATAVIIANNDAAHPDDLGSFTLGAAGDWVPTASISYGSGQAIRAGSDFGQPATVTIDPTDYAFLDGTSMATPHVSGCAAVAWAANPSLTAQQIRGILDATALDLGAPGWDKIYGFGLVDCAAAAAAAAAVIP